MIGGAAGAVLVAGGAAGFYALTNQGPSQKVTTTATQKESASAVTQSSSRLVAPTAKATLPQNIGLRMQYEETSEWCWIAVATSINHFYNPASTLTQGALMTIIGQKFWEWPSTTQCSPSAADLASDPQLASILADPYTKSAESVLNKPNLRIPAVCVRTGGVAAALDIHGNLNKQVDSPLTLATITQEIAARRPIAVDIKWSDGSGGHTVAIAGVVNDMLLICDPANGESAIQFEKFPAAYRAGASWISSYLTKKGP
jgi:hypothetical protein